MDKLISFSKCAFGWALCYCYSFLEVDYFIVISLNKQNKKSTGNEDY